MTVINNWSLELFHDDPLTAPEFNAGCIHGMVATDDGEKSVKTSIVTFICSSDGRHIETANGEAYVLGTVNPEYKEFVRSYSPDWDGTNMYWPLLDILLWKGRFDCRIKLKGI